MIAVYRLAKYDKSTSRFSFFFFSQRTETFAIASLYPKNLDLELHHLVDSTTL